MSAPSAAPGTSAAQTTSVMRSSRTMAFGTIVSQLTGFARTAVIIYALGTHGLPDAYNVANATPNIIYSLLLGGVLTGVAVPLLVRAIKTDSDAGLAYAQRFLTIVGVVIGALTIVAVVAAPAIVAAYGQGMTAAQRGDAVIFARFFLPQIFFYAIGASIGAILNTRGKFAAPMWTPVLNNLVVVVTGVIFLLITSTAPAAGQLTAGQTWLLGLGTTGGIVVQCFAMIPAMRATGFRFRPRFDWRNAGLREAGRLAGWVLVYVATNQVAMLVVMNLATSAGNQARDHGVLAGAGLTPYTNGFQLFRLPHAIIAVSIMTALLPRMSAWFADGRLDRVRADLSRGLRTTAVAIVPASAMMVALGPWLTTFLFAHGHTSVADAHYIGIVLAAFALGLVPFTILQFQVRAFFAMHDTRTPALNNLVATGANIAIDLVLYFLLPYEWKVVGLAFGYGMSYVVAVALMSRSLRPRLDGLDGPRVVRTHVQVIVASVVAAVVAWMVAWAVSGSAGSGVTGSFLACVAGVAAGGPLFLLLAKWMHIRELRDVLAMARVRAAGR